MKDQEKIELCSRIFIAWKLSNKAWNVHDDEILDAFIPGMLVKKMKAFGIDIFLPDPLLLLIDVCTESNPGQAQIILKDLLNNIVERTGKIKKGYMISAEDVAECWPTSFPIVSLKPELYERKWIDQKTNKAFSDNLCDTPEWWLEVMEH